MTLISHKYKFIYMKNAKVAGSSVEYFFEKYCVKDTEAYEAKEFCLKPIVSKYGIICHRRPNSVELKIRRLFSLYFGKNYRYYNHMPLSEIKRHHPDCYNTYFKFCVIRNPFDQVVSRYFFAIKNGAIENMSFQQFISTIVAKQSDSNNWKRMAIDNQLTFDYYIRFENLENDIVTVCKKLNLPDANLKDLPRLKAHTRLGSLHYKELYDEQSKNIVERVSRKELRAFGYKF